MRLVLGFTGLVALAACGVPPPTFGNVDASACTAYVVSPTLDTMVSKSFATDVMPLLMEYCTTCHGSSSAPSGNVFLGKSASDAGTVYKNIVNAPSGEYVGMSFVEMGDPTRSYLMHKLDGDQCLYDDECGGGSCQQAMPQSGGQLSESNRDTIRVWIDQGAQNN